MDLSDSLHVCPSWAYNTSHMPMTLLEDAYKLKSIFLVIGVTLLFFPFLELMFLT